jgi:hypothetical protein
MFRSTLPRQIIVDKETHQKLKDFLTKKNSGRTQEEIVADQKRRLKIIKKLDIIA